MLARSFGIFAFLFLALFVIQSLFFRNRTGKNSAPARWDIAPVAGFLGAVLLTLSFAEAARSKVIEAWSWGAVLGLIVSATAGVALLYGWNRRPRRNESFGHAVWGIARICSLPLFIAILGLNIAIRYVGASLEVFVASTIGVIIVAMAVSVFAISWRKKPEGRQ